MQFSRVAPRLGPALLQRRQGEYAERLKNLTLRSDAGLRKTVERARLTYDPRAERLGAGAVRLVERKRAQFEGIGPKLSPNSLRSELRHSQSLLSPLTARLLTGVAQQLAQRQTALSQAGKLLVSLSYKSVLARGYAVIKNADGHLVHERSALAPGDRIAVEFADGAVDAVVGGSAPPKKKTRPLPEIDAQESLF